MSKFSHRNKQNQPKMLNVGSKIKLFVIFCIISKVFYGQNTIKGIIVDSKTLTPIEFVDVYSNTDYTATNADGRFMLTTKRDSVNFRRLGYNDIKAAIQKLKTLDTIKLIKKEFELDEVALKNNATVLNEVFSSLKNNYPYQPYNEKFSLRIVLKKDGEIVKLQDLYGKTHRKSLFGIKKVKKNYEVELINMRKAGIEEEDYKMLLFSFNQFYTELTSLGIKTEYFDLEKSSLKNENYLKVQFSPKKDAEENLFWGYYIINQEDNSIKEYYSKRITPDIKYTEKKETIKYRTTFYERFITFNKSEKTDKYYIDKVKINATLELVHIESMQKMTYDYSYIMQTNDNFGDFEVDKNVSTSKDIFRLKFKYDKSFWKMQNQLLLTDEMNEFLNGIEKSEFETTTNLK